MDGVLHSYSVSTSFNPKCNLRGIVLVRIDDRSRVWRPNEHHTKTVGWLGRPWHHHGLSWSTCTWIMSTTNLPFWSAVRSGVGNVINHLCGQVLCRTNCIGSWIWTTVQNSESSESGVMHACYGQTNYRSVWMPRPAFWRRQDDAPTTCIMSAPRNAIGTFNRLRATRNFTELTQNWRNCTPFLAVSILDVGGLRLAWQFYP